MRPRRPEEVRRVFAERFAKANEIGADLLPEDATTQRTSVTEAARDEEAFAADFAKELVRLVMVYPDGDAEEMLAALREHYWCGEWHDARRSSQAKDKP